MTKISPKNAVLSGYGCSSMVFILDGEEIYHVLMKVKNKRGKGYRLRTVKVKL